MKNVIFNSDDYLMIKNAQNEIMGGLRAGANWGRSLSCPHYALLKKTFCFDDRILRKQDDAEHVISTFLVEDTSTVIEVYMAPDQC